MALRFQGRDFLTLREEMIEFLKERLGENWTDRGESDDLIILVELLSYAMDNAHYAIDMQKRESDIVTALLERNVVTKAMRDGYKPWGYQAAFGEVTLTFTQPLEASVDIPRGTYFQTEDAPNPDDNMSVVTLEDYYIEPEEAPDPNTIQYYNSKVKYPKGAWNINPGTGSISEGYTSTNELGALVEVAFKGTSIQAYGVKLYDGGYGRVFLDNMETPVVESISFKGDGEEFLIYDSGTIEDKEHVLRIEAIQPPPVWDDESQVWVYEDIGISLDGFTLVSTEEVKPWNQTAVLRVYQGELKEQKFSPDQVTQNGYIKLDSDRVADNHTRLFQGESREWTEVDDVYTDFRLGRYFSVHLKYYKRSTANILQLPYNWTIYSDGSTFTAQYLETMGASGYIAEGRVTKISRTLRDNNGNDLTKTTLCINTQPISGGSDRESVESIKINAKTAIKELETLVTLEDYEDFVRIWSGKEALAVDWRTAPGLQIPIFEADGVTPKTKHIVTEFKAVNTEIPSTGGPLTLEVGIESTGETLYREIDGRDILIYVDIDEGLRKTLVEELRLRQGRGDNVMVMKTQYIDYIIRAKCYLAATGDSEEVILQTIRNNIYGYFRELPQKGAIHFRTKIISLIHKASSRIKNVDLITPVEDIYATAYEIPRPVDIRIEFEVMPWA